MVPSQLIILVILNLLYWGVILSVVKILVWRFFIIKKEVATKYFTEINHIPLIVRLILFIIWPLQSYVWLTEGRKKQWVRKPAMPYLPFALGNLRSLIRSNINYALIMKKNYYVCDADKYEDQKVRIDLNKFLYKQIKLSFVYVPFHVVSWAMELTFLVIFLLIRLLKGIWSLSIEAKKVEKPIVSKD